ncbi:MAG: aminoacyl-tRNA hydrolase [Alphaproteobacteria bacterium]
MTQFLLAGLGNPGSRYAGHRHNIGFMVVDSIARLHGFSTWKRKFQGELADGEIDGHKAYLIKPQTFMNLSGDSVTQAAHFYKIPPEHIIVIHDELDLPLGKLRVKRGGGNGGHNGLKSLDAHMGPDYWRIRFGISHPGERELVSPYVLSDFAKSELPIVETLVQDISKQLGVLLNGDEVGFMNKLTIAKKE